MIHTKNILRRGRPHYSSADGAVAADGTLRVPSIYNKKNIFRQELPHYSNSNSAGSVVDLTDRVLILSYGYFRRLARLMVALLPLVVLLVGSCKTSQLPWIYDSSANTEQFRMALLPGIKLASHSPAAGYISRAKSFIVGQPESLTKLTQRELSFLFGAPTLQRKDADAEVWQYKTSTCVVDFYFYGADSAARSRSEASHIDIRSGEELLQGGHLRTTPISSREKSDCLGNVVAQDFPRIASAL